MAIEKCEYLFEGVVISGNHIGRGMGIPTVNIAVDDKWIIPQFGVYAATVIVNSHMEVKGIANLGVKPTIESYDEAGNVKPNPIGIEVNLFDFTENLYDKSIGVRFHGFVRAERKFNNLDELKSQIESDVKEVRKFFKEYE